MFNDFLNFFHVDRQIENTSAPYHTFLAQLGGMQFGNGLFTAFAQTDIEKWTKIAEEAYPGLKGSMKLFGHDWLGRIFAVGLRKNRHNLILMLEIGTGQALEIPCNLEDFLNEEMTRFTDACLAKSFYDEWRALGNPAPQYGQCAGYKIPLFLGGADDVTNIQTGDMEVYWGLLSQMKG